MNGRERFRQIYESYIVRDGAAALLDWLDGTDFYTAPASTRFHGAYVGGLVDHSVNVFDVLWRRLVWTEERDICSHETIAIVALLHDLCKVDYYGRRADGSWHVSERTPLGDHADKSVFLIQRFMKLSDEEIMAIRAHMGGWDHSAVGGSGVVGAIFGRCRLAVHLHIADLDATYLVEPREGGAE